MCEVAQRAGKTHNSLHDIAFPQQSPTPGTPPSHVAQATTTGLRRQSCKTHLQLQSCLAIYLKLAGR